MYEECIKFGAGDHCNTSDVFPSVCLYRPRSLESGWVLEGPDLLRLSSLMDLVHITSPSVVDRDLVCLYIPEERREGEIGR